MADTKTSALASLGTPVGADYVFGVLASGPTDKKLLASDLRDYTNMVQATGTDADTTMAINTLYVVDMSAWATASRTYTLPATAAVGDRIGVYITTGDDAYSLILQAGTGDSIIADGTTYTATEWTRLLSTGEMAIFRCTVANSTWIVESRKLNRLICVMSKDATTVVATATEVKIAVNETALDTSGGQADPTTNNRINIRRAGRYRIVGNLLADSSAITTGHVRIYKNGTILFYQIAGLTAGCAAIPADGIHTLAVGDYLELYARHQSGADRTYYGGASALWCSITAVEVL